MYQTRPAALLLLTRICRLMSLALHFCFFFFLWNTELLRRRLCVTRGGYYYVIQPPAPAQPPPSSLPSVAKEIHVQREKEREHMCVEVCVYLEGWRNEKWGRGREMRELFCVQGLPKNPICAEKGGETKERYTPAHPTLRSGKQSSIIRLFVDKPIYNPHLLSIK